jgi:hypothetical protein
MKNVFSKIIILSCVVFMNSCTKDDMFEPGNPNESVNNNLSINATMGIKLETPFVIDEVMMNVKTEVGGKYTIKILDISNRVVSKEEVDVKVGDNLLKVYTAALPSSSYRIALFDQSGKQLGITDFNKIN